MDRLWEEWSLHTSFLNSSMWIVQTDPDEVEILLASVLIHSYALAEAAAADALKCKWSEMGRIECWGAELLKRQKKAWKNVDGGEVGAVEAAVTRNAYAHGRRTVDPRGLERLEAVGSRRLGASEIRLEHSDLCRHRSHLKSLLNVGGFARRLG